MLGSVTIPGGFSVASPARYWAFLRYFSAISLEHNLRITNPFADLDPHQKAVLSDDFGVAITTQWLEAALNGFSQVVDGRRFVLHYAHLLTQPGPQPTKTGPTKCPDFVILDHAGRWHVLECKGTQTSLHLLRSQLDRARQQKQVIDIAPALAGHRLAAGVYLAADRNNEASQMEIQDPMEVSPLIRLDEAGTATSAANRLTAVRALGLAGYTQAAEEISIVETKSESLQKLLTREELGRTAIPIAQRREAAAKDLQREREPFEFDGRDYVGRQTSMEIFLPELGYEARKITVKHGVEREFLQRMRAIAVNQPLETIDFGYAEGANGGLKVTSDDSEIIVRQGAIAVSSVSFD